MKRLLLLTPPLVQTNTPYPATMHLTGFLKECGADVVQRDLSAKVARDVLVEYGGDTAEELLELLSGPAPAEAKVEASAWIDALAMRIRDEIDPDFGFSRYAERLGAAVADFSEVARRVRRRGVIDGPLERRLEEAVCATEPDVIGVTCPFPGTLVAAFKIARWVRRHRPRVRLLLGGGYVSTELRDMTDRRPYDYFDAFQYDEGYAPMLKELGLPARPVPAFVRPSYEGIDWSDYFDVVETENPMHRLWSVGRWRKLQMARGCYWHKCAFCDVKLPYVGCFEQPKASAVVDAMAALAAEGAEGIHFTDEAMPPALVRGVADEIRRRGLRCAWWGNVRFDAAYTKDLARRMAEAGCLAVTGGLECANDRLLALMNKGVTLDSARRALENFRGEGIMAHAYLMYGFPTETAAEAAGALETVRDLFRAGLLQSAFWHRFALTVHSPIAREPERFGIRIRPSASRQSENSKISRSRRVFARNEIPYDEPGAPDWEAIGRGLALATENYMNGAGLRHRAAFWLKAAKMV